MKPYILGAIFARGGSKGIPRKNIKLLNGKPLIAYAIECAKAVSSIDRVIVSTDDDEIASVAKKYGADVVRYFLLREIPSGEDGDFTYDKFEERYNADLAKGLGNLVSRVLTLAQKSDVKEVKNFKSEIKTAGKMSKR